MLTLPQIKQLTNNISDAFGVSPSDASALVQYYKDDDATLSRITAGDLSSIPAAAHALNINISTAENKANQDIKTDHTADTDELPPIDGRRLPHPAAVAASMAARQKKKNPPALYTDNTPEPAVLPDSLVQDIKNTVEGFCSQNNVDDLRKMPANIWRAACMAVGFHLQKSGALLDPVRTKQRGQKVYNAFLIAELVSLWAYLCAIYDKPPLASDFIAFTGVSPAWFYNCNGHGDATSVGAGVYKKVLQLQEAGLSTSLVDGRRNPTGTIFFLKNWHGWRDQREVIHTDGGSGSAPASYPTFMLEGASDGDEGGV